MLNKVMLIGRLGGDPAVKYTPGGNTVAQFSMATSETYKDKGGEKKETTQWHQVVVWGKLAEICGEYLTKGSLIAIVGKITYRTYDSKSGDKKFVTEIVAYEMKMLGGGKKQEQKQDNIPPPVGDDSDIPF
jgi:single-strand DNA-binding protein